MLPLISLRVDCTRRASLRTVIRARISACLVSVLLNSTNATCRTEVLCCYSNTVRFVAMRGRTAGPVDVSLALAISGTETCHAAGDAAVTKSRHLRSLGTKWREDVFATVISSEQRARRSRANSQLPRADAIPESGYHPVSNWPDCCHGPSSPSLDRVEFQSLADTVW
jgi:hypothetical protein